MNLTLSPVELNPQQFNLATAITYWAEAVSDATSPRLRDLMRVKKSAVQDFFNFTGKGIDKIGPEDIRGWRLMMEKKGLQATTIYNRLSFISSFFEWALKEPLLAQIIRFNPVQLVRPKAPKPYQSHSVQSLTDKELTAVYELMQAQATPTNLVGVRDYALFLLFITSGLRRNEILSLRGCDIALDGEGLTLTTRIKGGYFSSRKITEPTVSEALIEYLRQSKRLTILTKQEAAPLWLRHDRGAQAAAKDLALAPWSFARQMKNYAKAAGLTKRFHLHQLRHTFARIVAEESQSLHEVQEALEHRNPTTTRIYVQRIAVKRDNFSQRIGARLRTKSGE